MVIGAYVRLSKADKRNNSVSNSIKNQLLLINKYIENMNLPNAEIITFIDDGYSGRNEKRPAFKRLLAKMYLGELDIIIVKDFSRLSRDYLLIAQIRQVICPELGLRLISIADKYDSIIENDDELALAVKSLFDEYYCYDISYKVKMSLNAKKENGKYAVARLPYGYCYNEAGEVTVKKSEADIIKCIYNMALEGCNNREIVEFINKKYHKSWETISIWRILNNQMYAGYHIWHKYENQFREYGVKKTLPFTEWKISKDEKAAIIDEDIWNKVKIIRGNKKIQKSKQKRHIFHGITKCGKCKKALAATTNKQMLMCKSCGASKINKISINELYNIVCNYIEESNSYMKNDLYKELFLQIMIKRIEIYNNKKIEIYWNYNKL